MTAAICLPVIICLMAFTGAEATTVVSVTTVGNSSALSFAIVESDADVPTGTLPCTSGQVNTIESYLSNSNVKLSPSSTQVTWLGTGTISDAFKSAEFLIWLGLSYVGNGSSDVAKFLQWIARDPSIPKLTIPAGSTLVFQAPNPSISNFGTCYSN